MKTSPYWIGIDDLRYNDGKFRYRSTGSIASEVLQSWHLDNSPNNYDCAGFHDAKHVHDKPCSGLYSSICEMI